MLKYYRIVSLLVIATLMIVATYQTSEAYDSAIQIEGSEIIVPIPNGLDYGYVMVLLSDNGDFSWDAGIIFVDDSLGRRVHYTLGDPSNQVNTWFEDSSTNRYRISGDKLVLIFTDFPGTAHSYAAVLTIIDGDYNWLPDGYQNSYDFIPFEQFLNGLTTTPGSSFRGRNGTSSTTPTTITSTDGLTSDSNQNSSKSDETGGTTSAPSLDLNFSMTFAAIGFVFAVFLIRLKRPNL